MPLALLGLFFPLSLQVILVYVQLDWPGFVLQRSSFRGRMGILMRCVCMLIARSLLQDTKSAFRLGRLCAGYDYFSDCFRCATAIKAATITAPDSVAATTRELFCCHVGCKEAGAYAENFKGRGVGTDGELPRKKLQQHP